MSQNNSKTNRYVEILRALAISEKRKLNPQEIFETLRRNRKSDKRGESRSSIYNSVKELKESKYIDRSTKLERGPARGGEIQHYEIMPYGIVTLVCAMGNIPNESDWELIKRFMTDEKYKSTFIGIHEIWRRFIKEGTRSDFAKLAFRKLREVCIESGGMNLIQTGKPVAGYKSLFGPQARARFLDPYSSRFFGGPDEQSVWWSKIAGDSDLNQIAVGFLANWIGGWMQIVDWAFITLGKQDEGWRLAIKSVKSLSTTNRVFRVPPATEYSQEKASQLGIIIGQTIWPHILKNRLFNMIYAGREDEVDKLLTKHPDLKDARDRDGNTPKTIAEKLHTRKILAVLRKHSKHDRLVKRR